VEEEAPAQLDTNKFSPQALVIPRDERKRQQPMSVLSGMSGGGYYQ
jgi:hypothetical protein